MPVAIGATVAFLFISLAAAGGVSESTKSPVATGAVLVVLGLLSFWPVVVAYNVGHEAQAKYHATIANYEVLPGPGNYVRVWLRVQNVGKAAGAPTCMVTITPVDQFGDPMGSGGFDALAGTQTIRPGGSSEGYMDIVVSNNDAHYVTSKSMISVSGC